VLSTEQRALLRCVLNRLVPPHGALGGAGDLDAGDSIERTLSASPRLRRLFLDGLTQITVTAVRMAGADLCALALEQQTRVLQQVEQARPVFFAALVEHAYRGYYTRPVVQRALGSRPPQPIGYDLPPFDPSILEKQRERAPFWRRVE
jgi:hypothetical protein